MLASARHRVLAAGYLAALALGTSGCQSILAESTCGNGEYPVVRGDGVGGACVKDGEQPTGDDVRFPAHKVPDRADDFYSPTLDDYLTHGDDRQQGIAQEQLRRLLELHPDTSRDEILDGPIFPDGHVPDDRRP